MQLALKDYFRTHLKLDPGEITSLNAIIGLPWSIKLFYGFISDNVPLGRYQRSGYVVLMGLI